MSGEFTPYARLVVDDVAVTFAHPSAARQELVKAKVSAALAAVADLCTPFKCVSCGAREALYDSTAAPVFCKECLESC